MLGTCNRIETVQQIQRLHASLASAPSLEPGARINKTFTDLVNLCTAQYTHQDAEAILNDPVLKRILPNLRSLCATGEFLLEIYWAKRLVKAPRLQDFTNFRNYDLLVKLEVHCLLGIGARLNKLVFIGSGPLPLSSLLFAPSIKDLIVNIDRSTEAICVSKALTKAVGLDRKVTFFHGDALRYDAYNQADIVVLAALVGETQQEKEAMVSAIASSMKKGSIIMVRSTHRLRTVFYAPFVDIISSDLEPLVQVHPQNEVINSVLIYQKK